MTLNRYLHLHSVSEQEMDKKVVMEFLGEGLMMRDYNHPNVLQLSGVALRGTSPWIVLPYMENGDLKKFIKNPVNVSTHSVKLGFICMTHHCRLIIV
jgi:proto-oncogene tyrosine-protein kinase Met